jgi:hypothetical protein
MCLLLQFNSNNKIKMTYLIIGLVRPHSKCLVETSFGPSKQNSSCSVKRIRKKYSSEDAFIVHFGYGIKMLSYSDIYDKITTQISKEDRCCI